METVLIPERHVGKITKGCNCVCYRQEHLDMDRVTGTNYRSQNVETSLGTKFPYESTGLFKMIVGVLTTCHKQYT